MSVESQAVAETPGIDIAEWARDIIEGPGGMNDKDDHEVIVHHISERQAAAHWVIRCLANPKCEGSDEILAMIHAHRKEVATR